VNVRPTVPLAADLARDPDAGQEDQQAALLLDGETFNTGET
jgi:hypothetical protein